MATFKILSRVDAFVDYVTDIDAETIEQAVELAYEGGPGIVWCRQGVTEFDAREVVGLDADGRTVDDTARGDFG